MFGKLASDMHINSWLTKWLCIIMTVICYVPELEECCEALTESKYEEADELDDPLHRVLVVECWFGTWLWLIWFGHFSVNPVLIEVCDESGVRFASTACLSNWYTGSIEYGVCDSALKH